MVLSFPSFMIDGGRENIVSMGFGYFNNGLLDYSDAIENAGCYPATDSISIVELNKIKSMEFEIICIPDGYDKEIEGVANLIISDNNTFFLMYMATEKHYLDNFEKFEEFKNTVQIENTIDLSDYNAVSSVYDTKIKQEHLKITDSFNLPVILYDESEVSNFNFNFENSQMSFQPILNSDEYFQMDIETNGLLDSPYQIDINEESSYYIIINDTTTGKIIITVYSESPEIVTITGKLHANMIKLNDDVETMSIPAWIKNNAEFWAQDQIDDTTFIAGIQFLIKNKILNVSATTEIFQEQSNDIPAWIKNNAEFWAQGLISDDDFLNGIQYLINQGIIKV
jgi:TusA-related sulfurtransferase